MGRGGQDSARMSGAARRGGVPETCDISFSEITQNESDPAAVGEVVSFNGHEVEIRSGDPVMALKGLAGITHATSRPDGLYVIQFGEGNTALVDLDKRQLAFSGGDDYSLAQLNAAIYAAMAQRSLLRNGADPALQHLADAWAYHQDKKDEESLRMLAEAAHAAAQEENSSFEVNPTSLYKHFKPAERPSLLPRAAAREAAANARDAVRKAMQAGGPQAAAAALLHQVSEQGIPDLTDEQIEERRAAAEELGGEHLIPESRIQLAKEACGQCENCKKAKGNPDPDQCLQPKLVSQGEYYVGDQEQEYFYLFKNRRQVGQRTIILRGPPGSGKDAFLQESAALLQMPHMPFNIGPGFSLEDALGGDGLGLAKEYEDMKKACGECANCTSVTGLPDPDKCKKPKVTRELVASGTASVALDGPLTRAMQKPTLVVLQEPAGMEIEMVRLHSAAGDKVGEPSERYLTVNSTKGRIAIPVHPDCILALTFNSGEEDASFGTALHDRALNLDFEYPSEEEECRRYSALASKVLKNQQMYPELQMDVTPEMIKPVVQVMQQLRASAKENPDHFRRVPGGRQGVHFFIDLMFEGAQKNKRATSSALKTLRYLLPGTENMSPEERDETLDETLSDFMADLDKIALEAGKLVKD